MTRHPLSTLYSLFPTPYSLLYNLFTPPAPSSSEDAARLAEVLGLPVSDLASIRLGRRYHYRPFSVAKSDGRERRILAPSPALKELQRRLLHNYLQLLPVHPAAAAFFHGASVVDNASRHTGQSLIATLDLQDFFESTTANRIGAFFAKEGWRAEARSILMRLCVYRNGLPQGAPTSPALSNLVNWEMDQALTELACRSGAVYSRYGDDVTFSWRADDIPAYFEGAVRHILHNVGYQIQPRKNWQVYRASQEPQMTGLVIGRDGQVRAPDSIRRKVRWLRWLAWWKRDEETLAQLQGYEGFLNTPGLS